MTMIGATHPRIGYEILRQHDSSNLSYWMSSCGITSSIVGVAIQTVSPTPESTICGS